MSGNVKEWVEDFHDDEYYKNSPPKNPLRTDSDELFSSQVTRGGSWREARQRFQRCSDHLAYSPGIILSDIGFRLVLENK